MFLCIKGLTLRSYCVLQDFLRILVTLVYCYIVIKVVFPIVNAVPVDHTNHHHENNATLDITAEDRMVKPPRFPYDGPFGFYSSGLLCMFDETTYIGGWFGRSCAGPIAPFIQPTPPPNLPAPPTPPSTTTTPAPAMPPLQQMYMTPQQLQWMQMMMMGWGNSYPTAAPQPPPQPTEDPYEDYGDPVEGNPWEPDADEVFIESYGQRASKPGFRLGDPSRHSHSHH